MKVKLAAIRPFHTEDDYNAALVEFESYFDKEPVRGTEEADRFELLGILLAKYEEDHHRIDPPDPLEALRFRMEHSGRTQSDLAALLGSRSRASEILSGKRELTLEQIRLLNREWKIPVASLVGEVAAA
jgi:antitoxin component HigA of HigAB toxin-antitoxin module